MIQLPGARSWPWSSRLLILLAFIHTNADQKIDKKGQSFITKYDGDVNIGKKSLFVFK